MLKKLQLAVIRIDWWLVCIAMPIVWQQWPFPDKFQFQSIFQFHYNLFKHKNEMPKRRITCKVIKVSRSSDGTRTETLIENLFDSDSSSDDASGPSSHAESVNDDGISLPKLTLQIINDLFPNHCQCKKCSDKDEICRKCKESLDYNSSALPCWYRSSYITGLIFK